MLRVSRHQGQAVIKRGCGDNTVGRADSFSLESERSHHPGSVPPEQTVHFDHGEFLQVRAGGFRRGKSRDKLHPSNTRYVERRTSRLSLKKSVGAFLRGVLGAPLVGYQKIGIEERSEIAGGVGRLDQIPIGAFAKSGPHGENITHGAGSRRRRPAGTEPGDTAPHGGVAGRFLRSGLLGLGERGHTRRLCEGCRSWQEHRCCHRTASNQAGDDGD